MLGKVGIVGYGYVGKACCSIFKDNAEIIIIDPKYPGVTWEMFFNDPPAITFISVPAPTLDNGSVDTSIVENVLENLNENKYTGIIVIKSTIPPLDIDFIFNKFSGLNIVYSPEFLRELTWQNDAINPSQIILAGSDYLCTVVRDIYLKHANISRTRFVIYNDIKTAALAKYAINSFLATKVVFMNQLQQLYIDLHGTVNGWFEFTRVLENDTRIGHSHLQVPGNDGQYGYGGSCFPKDVKAMLTFDKNGRLSVLKEAEISNTIIRIKGKS